MPAAPSRSEQQLLLDNAALTQQIEADQANNNDTCYREEGW
jgi:hypothetical protein